jgi:endonuclease/exonuclease/phosphatase family metal-dependent hydrolase
VRFATFNVMHGRSLVDGRVDGERLSRAVAALDADLLGLQEVDRDQPRSGGLDLAGLAARALGVTDHHRFAAAVVGTPGERYRPAGRDDDLPGPPHYGIALISRWPVRSWRVLRLRAAPVCSPVVLPGGGGVVLLPDEPRVVLAAVVAAPFGTVTVATAHLSFVPGWNVHQLRTVLRALRQLPGPRILLGDLNLPGAVVRAVSRWRTLARVPTFPAPAPRVQLDHVLVDGRLPPVRQVCTPAVPVSDHRPLVVDLADRLIGS